MSEEKKYFDMWEELGIRFASYSQSIDRKVIDIMKCKLNKDTSFSSNCAKHLAIDEDFVELINYIFCSALDFDYGTSPRGCWPPDEEAFKEFIEKCEKQYKKVWIDHKYIWEDD